MKQTVMLTPEEGKILFNGSTYSEQVFIGALDSPDNWQEVPRQQYEAWLAEQERLMQEEAQSHESAY